MVNNINDSMGVDHHYETITRFLLGSFYLNWEIILCCVRLTTEEIFV